MSDIFVSYRRSDALTIVGRIIDHLEHKFDKHRIFRDLDSIEYGQDFGEVINRALENCEVLLVIIGKNWLHASNDEGERLLEKAEDWVRLEVATALRSGIRVIPVLVEQAEMPSASYLPEDLHALAKRHAAKVRDDPDFEGDMDRLCTAVDSCLSPDVGEKFISKPVLIVISCLCAILLGLEFYARLNPSRPSVEQAGTAKPVEQSEASVPEVTTEKVEEAKPSDSSSNPEVPPTLVNFSLYLKSYEQNEYGAVFLEDIKLVVEASSLGIDGHVDRRPAIRFFDQKKDVAPAIIRMAPKAAAGLAADISRILSSSQTREQAKTGMTVTISTELYALSQDMSGHIDNETLRWKVMPEYASIDESGRPTVEKRITLVLTDEKRGFWPIIARMNDDIARSLVEELRKVVDAQ